MDELKVPISSLLENGHTTLKKNQKSSLFGDTTIYVFRIFIKTTKKWRYDYSNFGPNGHTTILISNEMEIRLFNFEVAV